MLRVDTSSAVPPFEQLRVQLLEQIVSGDLVPGTQLPTVRRLAADLGLAPNTVARTYRELEQAGFVQTARRRGTIVAGPAGQTRTDAHRAANAFVQHMRSLGLDTTDIVQLVRQAASN